MRNSWSYADFSTSLMHASNVCAANAACSSSTSTAGRSESCFRLRRVKAGLSRRRGPRLLREDRRRAPWFLVAHDLDADHQPFAAHITGRCDCRAGQSAMRPIKKSPTRRAFSMYSVSQQVHRRQAPRQRTGLPPKGRRVRAGLPVHQARARNCRGERHTRGDALGHADNVRLDPGVFRLPTIFPCAPCRSALRRTRVGSMLSANCAGNSLHECRRRGNVTAFPLNGLDGK